MGSQELEYNVLRVSSCYENIIKVSAKLYVSVTNQN